MLHLLNILCIGACLYSSGKAHAEIVLEVNEYNAGNFVFSDELARMIQELERPEHLGDAIRYVREAIAKSRDQRGLLVCIRRSEGELLGFTLLVRERIGRMEMEFQRFTIYIPDEFLAAREYRTVLQKVLIINLERARELRPSALPMVSLGPRTRWPRDEARTRAQPLARENLLSASSLQQSVEIPFTPADPESLVGRRFLALQSLLADSGFRTSDVAFPRIEATYSEVLARSPSGTAEDVEGLRVPVNPYPSVEIGRRHYAILEAYRWFGTRDPANNWDASASQIRHQFYEKLEQNYGALLGNIAPGERELRADYPEFHLRNLNYGLSGHKDGETQLIIASFRSRNGAHAGSSLLVLAKKAFAGAEAAVLLRGVEQIIQREASIIRAVRRPNSQTLREPIPIRLIVESPRDEVREATTSLIRTYLAERGILADLEVRGFPLEVWRPNIPIDALREGSEPSAVTAYAFEGTRAEGRVRVIIDPNGEVRVAELHRIRLRGVVESQWIARVRFDLTAPLARAPYASSSRRIVFPLALPAVDLHAIRGAGGWRMEMVPKCQSPLMD